MIRKFELYDRNNDYYYGKIKEDGKIELCDKNNNYYQGKINQNDDNKFSMVIFCHLIIKKALNTTSTKKQLERQQE